MSDENKKLDPAEVPDHLKGADDAESVPTEGAVGFKTRIARVKDPGNMMDMFPALKEAIAASPELADLLKKVEEQAAKQMVGVSKNLINGINVMVPLDLEKGATMGNAVGLVIHSAIALATANFMSNMTLACFGGDEDLRKTMSPQQVMELIGLLAGKTTSSMLKDVERIKEKEEAKEKVAEAAKKHGLDPDIAAALFGVNKGPARC